MASKKYLALALLIMIGCSSTLPDNLKTVSSRYETVVFNDGISLSEAKIIAQNQLVKKNYAALYDLSKPHVDEDVAEMPDYQNYWFIFFEEKQSSSIPFIFMVVIDKDTGKVKFADDYNEGNRWILEAALLH